MLSLPVGTYLSELYCTHATISVVLLASEMLRFFFYTVPIALRRTGLLYSSVLFWRMFGVGGTV